MPLFGDIPAGDDDDDILMLAADLPPPCLVIVRGGRRIFAKRKLANNCVRHDVRCGSIQRVCRVA